MFDIFLSNSININFYFLFLLFLNIFLYIFLLVNIFLVLFLFDVKYIKTLTDLKIFNNVSYLYLTVSVIFLSFAGIPPLSGFIGKFLIFIYIFYKNNYLVFILFLFINMFIIYFYLQNLRFLVSKSPKNKFYFQYNKAYLNSKCVKYVNICNFFNAFLLIYIEEFLILINFYVTNLFF